MTHWTLTVACAFGVAVAAATAQECLEKLHTEDFDAYTAGLPLIPQQPCYPACPRGYSWQSWDNCFCNDEAEVSDRFARSAPNALRIVGGQSNSDVRCPVSAGALPRTMFTSSCATASSSM